MPQIRIRRRRWRRISTGLFALLFILSIPFIFALPWLSGTAMAMTMALAVEGMNHEWYLYPNHDLKLSTTPPPATSYSLTGGSESVWVAEPPESPVSVNPGNWILHLDYFTPCDICRGRLWIEVWNSSLKIADGNMFISTGYHGTTEIYMKNGRSAEFNDDEPLRLKLKWEPYGYTGGITLYCGESGTRLSGPSLEPIAPIPESSTYILLLAGLSLCVVSYYGLKRLRLRI